MANSDGCRKVALALIDWVADVIDELRMNSRDVHQARKSCGGRRPPLSDCRGNFSSVREGVEKIDSLRAVFQRQPTPSCLDGDGGFRSSPKCDDYVSVFSGTVHYGGQRPGGTSHMPWPTPPGAHHSRAMVDVTLP